ncbi:MAG: tryptophan--tRNA ligase [Xanthomonadales bacterium]|nr:tryptophan--tRNA ligase [Xanthomonadales bacterium]
MSRILTGITTTGTPHLGNYVGAIRPAIAMSREPANECFLFLADLHALTKCEDPERLARSRREIAATWLACGLDPERVVFYRQSEVPEIAELMWLLACVAAKGLLDRAHAYKAAVEANRERGLDPDAGISLGLFAYPVLMAADILAFRAERVPVGRDQVQHIEIARDLAQRFNHLYPADPPVFVPPEAVIDERVATLPGLDGRKMSKSYDNVVPLFAGGERALREAVLRIVTDSRAPGEPKDPESNAIAAIHRAFAPPEAAAAFEAELRAGLAWGEAKRRLIEVIESEIGPLRARYEDWIAHPGRIDEVLAEGARRARAVAAPVLAAARAAAGLRAPAEGRAAARVAAARPLLKQYREADGFHFKLEDGSGRLLLKGGPYPEGRQAGEVIARLRRERRLAPGDECLLAAGVSAEEAERALASLGG